ncbi:MAG: RNA polymerase sigma factor [Candidatus Dojkabacteria bacterium]
MTGNYADKSDKDLVRLYKQSSDKQSFAEIYDRYVGDVYRIVYMRTGRKEWSEEIVSDTFFTLMSVLKNFRGDSKLKTFIIGIAINKVRQFWQKKEHGNLSLMEEIVIVEEEEGEESEDGGNNAQSGKRIDKRIVAGVLEMLHPPYSDVLRKRFIESRSIKETASELDLSEANVRVIQHRAIKKALPIANRLIDKLDADV